MNLPDHRQRLPGIGMCREAVDKRLQNVQRFDPAFLVLQRDGNCVDRVLQIGVAASTCEVQFQKRLDCPQRLSELLPCLRDPQG